MSQTAIIGAGPAGLSAAYELTTLGLPAVVFEQDMVVGGIARTESYKGYHFDIGGHRFFTKVPLIQQLWEEVLGEDFLTRPRLSRIFYNGRFFDYPLKPLNALVGLGLVETVRICVSYIWAQVTRGGEETHFEEWVINRFGRRLYEIFFKTYTEKVWGIPCTEIQADWAAQRIKNLDLFKAVRHAFSSSGRGDRSVTSLIDSFHYPRLGPGMMWERFRELLDERGVETRFGSTVVELERVGDRIRSVTVATRSGERHRVETDRVISSMPIQTLVRAIRPRAPRAVLEAAAGLRYRDFLTVVLIVDRAELFPDNWIYIHSPDVQVGRIQNFKNWSPEMVPDPDRSSLGLEYFVQENDELWNASDDELIALGRRETAALGLVREEEVIDGCVLRMPKAYPVYDQTYRVCLDTLRGYLDEISNLQTIGRNGLHRYNNQDHSMLTGIYAARNIAGENYDLWSVNVEEEYHEEVAQTVRGRGDPLVPARVGTSRMEELLRSVFARFDPVALGLAVGVLGSLGILTTTALLLLGGGEGDVPTLSLLGNYLFGFNVSWPGALLGGLEAGGLGFGLGYVMARAINLLLQSYETSIRRQLELMEVLDSAARGAES